MEQFLQNKKSEKKQKKYRKKIDFEKDIKRVKMQKQGVDYEIITKVTGI